MWTINLCQLDWTFSHMFRQWTWNLDRTAAVSFITLVLWPLSWTIIKKKKEPIFLQENHLGGPKYVKNYWFSTPEGWSTSKTCIFAHSYLQLSSFPGENWDNLTPKCHLNFVIQPLEKLYTKGQPPRTNTGREISNLLHPYQSGSSSELTTIDNTKKDIEYMPSGL